MCWTRGCKRYFTEPKNLSVKAQMNVRFFVLVLSSWLMIGSYYCYDNPSALQDQLRSQFHDMSKSDFDLYFNLLYTVYSIPNIVLPFFGGYFVDWFGARWMNVIFSSLITCGQLLFAFGDSIKSFPVMLAGRVLFGFGGESLSVGCSTIIADWFIGRELAFALGVNISIARIGSVVNDIASPALATAFGSVAKTLFFGVGICASSTMAACCVIPIDSKAEKRLVKLGHKSKKTGVDREEQIHLSDVKSFQLSFWLLTISCVVIYGCVLPWNNIAQSLIIQKFICHGECPCPANQPLKDCTAQKDAEHKASFVMGIPYTMSACLSPFLGGAIDKIGGRAILSVVSSVALIGVHTSISLLNGGLDELYGPLVFQGLAYAVFAAALWPSVPYVVERHQTGTAYGIMTAIQNGGLALFPVIIGEITSKTDNNYSDVEWFFVGLACLGLATAITLNVVDYRRGSVLNLPHFDVHGADDDGSAKEPLMNPINDTMAVVTPPINMRSSSMDLEADDASRVRFAPHSPEIDNSNFGGR